jgi:hypothetical protein
MDTDDIRDQPLVARLKRLDASTAFVAPGFDYDRLLERHAEGVARSRRRLYAARGAAVALLLALVGASLWRLDERDVGPMMVLTQSPSAMTESPAQPRIVRADTYFAVAALEDHIASVDDALNYARIRGGAADVARLERARAELLASYSQLRYAERVSANF